MGILLITTILACLFGALYLYSKWMKNYWKRRGVTSIDTTTLDTRNIINDAYHYLRSKGKKFGGVVVALKPIFIPVDLDLLKMIMIKNFDHFVNHGAYHNDSDKLSASLFSLEDDKWKNLRTKLTPAFTSGKMKMLFQTMISCTEPLVDVLKKEAKLGPIDTKDVMARFTSDVIGSGGFGIDCNSLNDPNCEFRQFGKKITGRSWKRNVVRIVPHSILKLINFSTQNQFTIDFVMNLIPPLIEYREKNNIFRKDYLHLLLQLKNRGKVEDDEKIMDGQTKGEYFTIYEIATQCLTFLVAGFETSSGAMTFALLELAQCQEVQEKLRKEIKSVTKKHGSLTYDAIMDMSYLDQVVSETLRLHPPGFATNRICNKDFPIPGTDVVIQKGTNVLIPIYGIQHDADIYPDPEKFEPERFSADIKATRHPMSYMPFGDGPRMCIGARYGLLQSKVGLACVIGNFKVTMNPKTQTPIKYNMSSLTLSVEGDVWLNFDPLD